MSFVLRRADDAAFKWDRELLIGLHDRILAGSWAAGFLRPVGRARSRTYHAGTHLHARIGAALGVPVQDSGEPGRAALVGELAKRVAAERSSRA
jgi:hypothetical protein